MNECKKCFFGTPEKNGEIFCQIFGYIIDEEETDDGHCPEFSD